MTAWWEARRCRDEDSHFSEAAALCLTATIWAWRRTEDREDWAERVVELSKGAGAPRRRRLGGGDPDAQFAVVAGGGGQVRPEGRNSSEEGRIPGGAETAAP